MKKLALLLALPLAFSVSADDNKAHDCHAHSEASAPMHLVNCAIQETIPGAKATGAFLIVHRHGSDELSLVSASAPTVTDHVEIHEMITKDGTMKMSQIKEYPLKDGDNVFKKGGYHIMLMDLDKKLAVGEIHALNFTFSDGSKKSCDAIVKSVESLTPKGMKMHHHGDMKHDAHKHDMKHDQHKHKDAKS